MSLIKKILKIYMNTHLIYNRSMLYPFNHKSVTHGTED